MPIYEYACTQCGSRAEVMHGVNDVGPERCTVCGAAMRKLLSAPAIVFKGSGWAKKDARPAPSSSEAKEGASDDAAPKGGGGTASKDGDGSRPASGAAAPAKAGEAGVKTGTTGASSPEA